MDVYKRGHFIFESKQGIAPWDPAAREGFQTSTKGHTKNPRGAGVRDTSAWRDAMSSGRVQVGRYAVAVTKRGDPKPPFIVLADLGYRLWIWSSFSPDAADDYGDFEELADGRGVRCGARGELAGVSELPRTHPVQPVAARRNSSRDRTFCRVWGSTT